MGCGVLPLLTLSIREIDFERVISCNQDMKLVERHIITKCHPCWSEIDRAAFLSKNLFNLANYHYRQYFLVEHKKLNFNQLYHQVAQSSDYLALPTKVAKQIIRRLDKAPCQ